MDYCNNETMIATFSVRNFEGLESRVQLYKVFVPILLVGCLFSVLLNAVLVAVGSVSRSSIRSRSPILVLSLNLAATDGLASLLMGIGLVLNSFLPVVLNVDMASNRTSCTLLVVEILRMSALIASAMHLLAMALVHYKGIVNPLHYRSVIFCSQHRTRSIYLMTSICWLVPAAFLALYFSWIPCQGFQTDSCRSEFIVTFSFRIIVVIAFFLPLLFMFILYFRIFAIIKRHQAQRAVQRQQSCQISTRSRTTYSSPQSNNFGSTSKHSPLVVSHSFSNNLADARPNGIMVAQPKDCLSCANEALIMNDNPSNQSATLPPIVTNNGGGPLLSLRRQHLQRQQRFNSLVVTAKPEQKLTKTTLYREPSDLECETEPKPKKLQCLMTLCSKCCKQRLARNVSSKLSHSSASSSSINIRENAIKTTNSSNTNAAAIIAHQPVSSYIGDDLRRPSDVTFSNIRPRHSPGLTRGRLSQGNFNQREPSGLANTGHGKALITTLLILGTYIICWMPAVVFFALTCVDYCPFPITTINFRLRIIVGFVTNALVILKAIVDPFIYTYRMKEMKSALNRCFAFVCPSFVMALCPKYDPTSSQYSRSYNSQQNSFSRSSASYRGIYPGANSVGGLPSQHQAQLCRWATRTTSWGGDQLLGMDTSPTRPNGPANAAVLRISHNYADNEQNLTKMEDDEYELKQLN